MAKITRKEKVKAKNKFANVAEQIATSNFIHRFNKQRKIARATIRETFPDLCPVEEDCVKF